MLLEYIAWFQSAKLYSHGEVKVHIGRVTLHSMCRLCNAVTIQGQGRAYTYSIANTVGSRAGENRASEWRQCSWLCGEDVGEQTSYQRSHN